MDKTKFPKGISSVSSQVSLPTSLGLLASAVVIMGLYLAQDALIPLALAILLSFILTPVILFFRNFGVSSSISVPVVLALLLGTFLSVGYVLAGQIVQLTESLPTYQYNLRNKIRDVKTFTDGDTLKRASEALKNIEKEIETDDDGPHQTEVNARETPHSDAEASDKPIEVQISGSNDDTMSMLNKIFWTTLAPFTTMAITLIFSAFILLQREDLRDRLIRLFGAGDLTRTTQAMDDAAARLGRFFFVQSVLNVSYGILIGFILSLIGLPNAVLWGVIAGLMRYVPYIGTVIALAGPVLLAGAIDPGWQLVALTAALFLTGEFMMGQVLEPLIYGHNAGLSPLAVVVTATFWTLLWGGVGLLLAVPLTLIVVTLGQHVEKLEFISILLGNEPALSDEQKFYQRLLAGDDTELALQAEDYITDVDSLIDYMDNVAIAGLLRAQSDYSDGRLDKSQMAGIRETLDGLTSDIKEIAADEMTSIGAKIMTRIRASEKNTDTMSNQGQDVANQANDLLVKNSELLIYPGTGPLDRTTAELLNIGLEALGQNLRVMEGNRRAMIAATASEIQKSDCEFVVVSALGDVRQRRMHFLLRRLNLHRLGCEIIFGSWGSGKRQDINLKFNDTELLVPNVSTFRDLIARLSKNGVSGSKRVTAQSPDDASANMSAQAKAPVR